MDRSRHRHGCGVELSREGKGCQRHLVGVQSAPLLQLTVLVEFLLIATVVRAFSGYLSPIGEALLG